MLAASGIITLISFVILPRIGSPDGALALLSVTLFFRYWGSLYWSLPAILVPKDKVGMVGSVMNFAASAGLFVLSSLAIDFPTGNAR